MIFDFDYFAQNHFIFILSKHLGQHHPLFRQRLLEFGHVVLIEMREGIRVHDTLVLEVFVNCIHQIGHIIFIFKLILNWAYLSKIIVFLPTLSMLLIDLKQMTVQLS